MNYRLNKHITPKKRSAVEKITHPLIFIVLIPVLVIAFLSFAFVSLLLLIKNLFVQKEPEADPYFHEERILIEKHDLQITMVDDEGDKELTDLNESWAAKVFGRDTYLYRVRTVPFIPELHGSICGYYLQENNDGAFLQQLNNVDPDSLQTRMLFLDYTSAVVSVIGDIGAFYLYNDEKTQEIKGFNESENIRIDINPD